MFKPAKVLVVGDFMLDVYTIGSVGRISPEAPVPVLHVHQEERRPGGAGNAVLNLRSLGMEVSVCGRVGDDAAGRDLAEALAKEGVDVRGLTTDTPFPTPLKSRMIADNQQLLRVDYEKPRPLEPSKEQKIIEQLPSLLTDVAVVAISDYAKGFLTLRFLLSLFSLAEKRALPVIVDPKGVDFTKYRGATLLKPNLIEAIHAAGLEEKTPLDRVAEKILQDTDIETLMITRSKEGISLFDQTKGRRDFPAKVHEVKDVTGAGDTVLAIMTAALASGMKLERGAELANLAAGIAIERFGCARISVADLEHRLKL